MDFDEKMKRGIYIGDSTEIRETFAFVDPSQVLRAVRIYCGHYYGAMLWDLNSEMTGQMCRSWNTCVKLAYDIPRSTHTYIVENILASNFLPVKTELMARFSKFYQNLVDSDSLEISVLAKIVSTEVNSTTAKNLALITKETGVQAENISPSQVRKLVKIEPIPVNQEWRGPLLHKLLNER